MKTREPGFQAGGAWQSMKPSEGVQWGMEEAETEGGEGQGTAH